MEFNEKLIELRKSRGLSQEALGNIINVTRQTVSKWELKETTPEMSKLVELAKYFQISVDELIGKETQSTSYENNSFHYEYVSRHKIKGVPVVHINIGFGRKLRKAKGIIAIGNIANGIISIGLLSVGLVSFGCLSLGLLSLGALSFGILISLGGLSVGSIAIGGLAIGIFSVGGGAIGFYAIGGGAIAKNIAVGGFAGAHIAIGNKTHGTVEFLVNNGTNMFTADEVKASIIHELPNTPKLIISIFYAMFSV